jgi:hypothetical protein
VSNAADFSHSEIASVAQRARRWLAHGEQAILAALGALARFSDLTLRADADQSRLRQANGKSGNGR